MFVAGRLYEQEHIIYTCKYFKLSFGRFFVSTIITLKSGQTNVCIYIYIYMLLFI